MWVTLSQAPLIHLLGGTLQPIEVVEALSSKRQHLRQDSSRGPTGDKIATLCYQYQTSTSSVGTMRRAVQTPAANRARWATLFTRPTQRSYFYSWTAYLRLGDHLALTAHLVRGEAAAEAKAQHRSMSENAALVVQRGQPCGTARKVPSTEFVPTERTFLSTESYLVTRCPDGYHHPSRVHLSQNGAQVSHYRPLVHTLAAFSGGWELKRGCRTRTPPR